MVFRSRWKQRTCHGEPNSQHLRKPQRRTFSLFSSWHPDRTAGLGASSMLSFYCPVSFISFLLHLSLSTIRALLLMAGIEPNPGPFHPCGVCSTQVTWRGITFLCLGCEKLDSQDMFRPMHVHLATVLTGVVVPVYRCLLLRTLARLLMLVILLTRWLMSHWMIYLTSAATLTSLMHTTQHTSIHNTYLLQASIFYNSTAMAFNTVIVNCHPIYTISRSLLPVCKKLN